MASQERHTDLDKNLGSRGNFITVDVYSDSIFKYLESRDGVDVNLTAIRGGKISDITEAVNNFDEPDIVVIHTGTNDLTNPRSTLASIKRMYEELVMKVQSNYKCPVVLSAILPRRDRPDLEPLRIAVNHLISSFATGQMIHSNQEFSFKTWDDECSDDFFFSVDGLHPSRGGNKHLHNHLRTHLMWILSGERDVSRKIVGSMITKELMRTRMEANKLRVLRMEKRTNSSVLTSTSRPRPTSRPTFKCVRRRYHRTPPQPRDRTNKAPTGIVIYVAGCPVVCPRVSGWGLRTRQHEHQVNKKSEEVHLNLKKNKHVTCDGLLTSCPFCTSPTMTENDLLDHYLENHHIQIQQDSTDRQIGGGKIDRTRGECASVQFTTRPFSVKQVSAINKGKSVSSSFFVNVSKLDILPPLTQLKQMRDKLIRLEKIRGEQLHFVELNSGQRYSVKEIEDAIVLHELKNVGRDVVAEKAWIHSSYDTIYSETPPSNQLIEDFCDLIFNNPPEAIIPLHGDVLSVEDLAALTRTSWLSNFLIMFFTSKLEKQCNNVKCRIVGNAENIPKTITPCLTSSDLSNDGTTIILYSLVNSNGSSTTFGQSGNHFVFSVYSSNCNTLVYADPLGGNIPEGYIQHFKCGLRSAGVDPDSLVVTLCHDHLSRNEFNTHKCSQNCASFYPLQTCSSVCGVAAIVGMTIAALNPQLFKIMTNIDHAESQQVYKVKYLQKITKYSAFLRRVIINWILAEEIDLSILLRKDTSTTPQTQSTQSEEDKNCVLVNTIENKSPVNSVSGHLSGIIFNETETSQEIKIKNGLACSIKVLELLQKDPKVSYSSTTSRLVLQLFPVGTKSQIVKKVLCNKLKAADSEAKSKLNAFLQSEECMAKILKLGSGKRLIKEDHANYWEHITDIRVGQDMKHYFDKFTFDIVKIFKVEKIVSPKYQQYNATLKVSVTENPKWGQTHRLDETYTFLSGKKPEKCIPVVKLYVSCSSRSSECRSQCGSLLTSINTQKGVTNCSGCGTDLTKNMSNTCAHCQTTDTPQWYKYFKDSTSVDTLCSPCYRYIQKYNTIRPQQPTQQPTLPHNNKIHHPHLSCYWKMKCVIFSDDLDVWKLYVNDKNQTIHRSQPCQQRKRPSLTDRDEIDRLRASNKVSANQIKLNFQRKTSIHVNEEESIKQLRETTTQSQIQNRIEIIDKHALQHYIHKQDPNPLFGSDWRNTEKILEQHVDSVLFFQRGFKNLDRNYHFVLANNENLNLARKFGEHIMGYDNKYDFTSCRFPVGLLSICDLNNKGRAVAISMSSSEQAKAHALTLKAFLFNVPCNRKSCDHKQEIYKFNDGHGFFKFRPCSFHNPLRPMIQHDKDPSIKAAVASLGLKSSLCNFHALQALRRYIHEDPTIKLFIQPLENGFKSIMRSWTPEVRESIIDKFIHFINVAIPNKLLSPETKQKLIQYLEKNWFHSNWSSSFTAEILYDNPVTERRNPLLLTDNVTERKFRQIDEAIFNSQLNRSTATFLMKMIDQFLYSEGKTSHCQDSHRRAKILHVEKELRCAERGIEIIMNNRLIQSSNSSQDGWFGIAFDSCRSVDVAGDNQTDLPDEHFVGNDMLHSDIVNEIEFDYIQRNMTASSQSLSQLSKQITSDHNYDVHSKVKQLLSRLEFVMAENWHNELLSNISSNIDTTLNTNNCQYVCNINIGICSCYGFITKGQPYFCKHLYAAFSKTTNIIESAALIDAYRSHSPTFQNNIPAPPPSTSVDLLPIVDSLKQISHIHVSPLSPLLVLLHDKPLHLHLIPGKLAARQPHNLGLRRKTGPVMEPKYSLVNTSYTDTTPSMDSDPYRPQVPFPDKAKERHGGRKRSRPSTRGVLFKTMVSNALHSLGHIFKEENTNIMDGENSTLPTSEEDPVTSSSPPNTADTQQADNSDTKQADNSDTKQAPNSQKKRKPSLSRATKSSMLCMHCITDNCTTPFKFPTLHDYNQHILTVHCKNHFLCAICFEHSGVISKFTSIALFRLHEKQTHHAITLQEESSQIDLDSVITNGSGDGGLAEECSAIQAAPIVKKRTKLSLSRKRKSSNAQEIKHVKFQCHEWACPKCLNPCSNEPPSICCDQCDVWYHFKCVGLLATPPDNNHWYCTACG